MAVPYQVSKETKKMKELLGEEYDETKTSKVVPATAGGTLDSRVKPMPALPAPSKKPKPNEIKEMIKAVPVFKMGYSVVNKREGPSDLLPPQGSVVKNMMTWQFGRQDSVFYAIMQQVGYEMKVPEDVMEKTRAYVLARLWAGGSFQGLCARLQTAFKDRKVTKLDVNRDHAAAWINKMLPVRRDMLPDLSGNVELKDVDIDINYKSSAGAPFLSGVRKQHFSRIKTTVSVAKMWHSWAERIALVAGKFEDLAKFFKENEDLFVACLANKYAIMERADLPKKVRPYYRFPAGVSFLFQVYTQPLQKSIASFWEDPMSCSALRFSWSHGGLRRLQEWARKQPQGFSFLVYGDDILMLFKIGGRTFVCAPDCQFLDMSLIPDWAWIYSRFNQDAYREKFSERWKNILSIHMKLAWVTKVVVEGGLTVVKTSGLNSGVVGTTLIDCCASALACKVFKDDESEGLKSKNAEDLKAWSALRWGLVKRDLGLQLKPGTDTWVEWDLDKVPLPVKFLGYVGHELKLRDEEKRLHLFWVPVKPPEEWFATLCYNPTEDRDGVVDKIPPVVTRLSVLFGCYFSGGYVSPWAAEAIKRLFTVLRDTPGAGFKPHLANIDNDEFDLTYLKNQIPWLPDRLALARFYGEEKGPGLSEVVRPYHPPKGAGDTPLSRAEIEDLKDADVALEDYSVHVHTSPPAGKGQVKRFAKDRQATDKHFGKQPPDFAKAEFREKRQEQQRKQVEHILKEERADRKSLRGKFEPPEDDDHQSTSDRSTDLKFHEDEVDDNEQLDTMEDYREKERNKERDQLIADDAIEKATESFDPQDSEAVEWDYR